jgi:hypothetical protein
MVGNDPVDAWDVLGMKVFVVSRNLAIASKSGDVFGLTAVSTLAGGIVVGSTVNYYLNNTWHCILVVADRCSPALDSNGDLVDLNGVAPDDTWDFQSSNGWNHPAADWSGGGLNTSTFSRWDIVEITSDNSSDQAAINAANASQPGSGAYDVGGNGRNNCCDWVSGVLSSAGLSYANPNSRPFGDNAPPWWVAEWVVELFID